MRNKTINRDRVRKIYQERLSELPALHADDAQLCYLLKYLPKRMDIRILDAGCGDGRYSLYLANLGYTNILAVDLFEKLLQDNLSYQQASIDALPFHNDSFDFVFSNSVIFYVDPPSKGLAEFYRVLKPGGLVIFTAHTRWSLFTLQRCLKRDFLKRSQMSHLEGVKFYSSSYYHSILVRLGFRVELRDGWRYSFFFYPMYLIGSSIVKRLLGLQFPQLKPWMPTNRILRRIKSEVSYHSIFVARK